MNVRRLPAVLVCVVLLASGCATKPATATSDPKLGGAAATGAPGVVSCDAILENKTGETLTLTFGADPGSGWGTNLSQGMRVPNGGSVYGKIETIGNCSARLTFSGTKGGFTASFKNPWNSASTWGCSNVTAPVNCSISGNEHGQPLKVRFVVTAK
jgi:hypothetical protein